MSGATVLDMRDLHVRFPQLGRTVHAVRGCNLKLEAGRILGLVGESGSGKSVTALSCLGMVPRPGQVSGSVMVAGRQVVGGTDRELQGLRGRGAAMIFQNPATTLNPFFTVGQQLTHVIRHHLGLDQTGARRAAIASLNSVRLPDPEIALSKYPHQMSGGQAQRVVIAMAIACKPQLLIADEPTTALDVTIQAQIILLLEELVRAHDLAVLFITHDLGVVASLCDRVAVMYAGSVVEEGDVETVFANAAHPYTRRLLETVPAIGAGHTELVSIQGQVPDLARLPSGCPFHPRCTLVSNVCRSDVPHFRSIGERHGVACHHAHGALSPCKPLPAKAC